MAQHDYVLDNASGSVFRADLNSALQAIVSLNAGTAAPSTTYAYQLWYDTTNALLKIRNAANSAWVTMGPVADSTQWAAYSNGVAQLTIDSSGNVSCSATGAVKVPVGTTGQRPTAVQGQIRYNTTLSQFEGYNGTAWGAIGGAGNVQVDTFSGNGSTTAFTLTADPGSRNNTFVFISGVYQAKTNYTAGGSTTLTFTSAPPSGTNNIQVLYGTSLSVGVPSDGSVTPVKLSTGGPTWDSNGNLAVTSATGSLGYGTGAGGTVTQATSKSTGVTLNKSSGQITMNAAALAAGAIVSFGFSNSLLASGDILLVQTQNNANGTNYRVWASNGSAGGCNINIQNISGGSLSEAVVIVFSIIKAASA